ncbi:hypothetical protein [Yoonia sp. R78084]|uniref:hypothetical protein n=1 Tax=Yoonia sp. R78084 TaxID=3093869 RepID=UPI0037DC66E7
MEDINPTVEGEIISINLSLYEIEICYIHSKTDEVSGLVAKHPILWCTLQKDWLEMQLYDVQERLINSRISNLVLSSGRAQFQIGDEFVEVVQEGPTEYLELWWGKGDSHHRIYI